MNEMAFEPRLVLLWNTWALIGGASDHTTLTSVRAETGLVEKRSYEDHETQGNGL